MQVQKFPLNPFNGSNDLKGGKSLERIPSYPEHSHHDTKGL